MGTAESGRGGDVGFGFIVPEKARDGLHPLSVVVEGTALSADCFAVVTRSSTAAAGEAKIAVKRVGSVPIDRIFEQSTTDSDSILLRESQRVANVEEAHPAAEAFTPSHIALTVDAALIVVTRGTSVRLQPDSELDKLPISLISEVLLAELAESVAH